ncbi:hypothetical protein JJD41_10955 [Oxynema sp. CENA135]|nr:hypothetical protein [Oxynema sp. CENA135]MBK4730376.1 hypothetical protein [Oxynema sp. CENA135]
MAICIETPQSKPINLPMLLENGAIAKLDSFYTLPPALRQYAIENRL